MCTSIIEIVRAEGMAKRGDQWFPLSHSVVAYDHARHANLGDGEIGLEGMIAFLSEPRFEGLPVIFESARITTKLMAEDLNLDADWATNALPQAELAPRMVEAS